jgi:hypothetical protein
MYGACSWYGRYEKCIQKFGQETYTEETAWEN